MRTATVLVGVLLSSSAWGACPWAGADEIRASASLGEVYVNGETFRVRGHDARRDFEEVLQDCDADRAVKYFRRWRSYRRSVNIWGGISVPMSFVVIGWGTLGLTIGYAASAPTPRNSMLDEIEASKPPAL